MLEHRPLFYTADLGGSALMRTGEFRVKARTFGDVRAFNDFKSKGAGT